MRKRRHRGVRRVGGRAAAGAEGVSEFLGLEYEAGMSEPYRERAERMTDGVRAESKMLGDIKFHEHRGIEAGVGERWRAAAGDLEIGEVTRELARSARLL